MKKTFFALLAVVAMTLLAACKYDDGPLWDSVHDLDNRLKTVEEMCFELNTNVSALQSMVTALQQNDYIRSITPLKDANDRVTGYRIEFVKSGTVTIYHGQDGKDGQNGQDGANGSDGNNGADGSTPQVGIVKHEDGNYYWTLNGEMLLDNDGNMIPASASANDGKDGQNGSDGQNGADGKDGQDGKDGADGKDGQDGKDGKDGITPQLKIENGRWLISVDNGETWTDLGPAQGADGKDGKDGQDGKDGVGGESMFSAVDYTSSTDYVTFTLLNGEQIKIPTWAAFEALRTLCNQMNTNINSLQTLVNALQSGDYITAVTPLMENRVEVGYIITFSKSNPISIYHGKDGQDGQDGINGQDGTNGTDGKDAVAPVVSVKVDSSDSKYYWTVNGEWLYDENGNKILAQATDGKDGQAGKDAIAPKLKIEDGNWFMSTDGGKTWQDLGPAKGQDGDTMFSDVIQTEDSVNFIMSDGTVISIPKTAAAAKGLKITFSQQYDIPVWIEKETEITYTVTGNGDKPVYLRFSGNSATVTYTHADNSSGKIVILPQHGASEHGMSSEVEVNCEGMESLVTHLTYSWDITRNDNVFLAQEEIGAIHKEYWVSGMSAHYVYANDILRVSENYRVSDWRIFKISESPTTEVPEYAFNVTLNGTTVPGFYNIIMPNKIQTINNSAFSNTHFQNLELPNTLQTIGDYAFDNITLDNPEIKIPQGVKSIGKYAFGGTNITQIDLPESLESIGDRAFSGCKNLTSIRIPSKITEIGNGTFSGCSNLTTAILPDGLIKIGDYAFSGCTNLSSISIPENVTTIYAQAFGSTKEITFKGSTPPSCSSTYGTFASGATIKVPSGSIDDYKNALSKDANYSTYTFIEY